MEILGNKCTKFYKIKGLRRLLYLPWLKMNCRMVRGYQGQTQYSRQMSLHLEIELSFYIIAKWTHNSIIDTKNILALFNKDEENVEFFIISGLWSKSIYLLNKYWLRTFSYLRNSSNVICLILSNEFHFPHFHLIGLKTVFSQSDHFTQHKSL